ncbi:DUF3618 domain-containing protein [Brachybacterium sp. YJGR34]|uniref:DUF3618 domain-containing protein n=1 Tax=Brachybacterium sp. YJGR34 TaxID=2059911 RepID=UPI000E0A491D|nr:DUF3618 domain-containing protein [Brachybacterium sp. YJGR34]
MATKKSLDDMRDEAYRRQDNLASDIDELVDRVNPKNAARRWKNEVLGSVKGFSDAGDGKTSATLPAIAGGVIGVVLLGAGVAAAIVLSGGDEDSEKKTEARKARAAKERARAAKS